MPLLKDLHCFIEFSDSRSALKEFGTVYGDGFVETFVSVPRKPQPFAVRLTSSTFIAPGLAMFVFIDGAYQCNRNRQGLKPRDPPDHKSVVDFCVRQKEERQKDGTMIARDWSFEKLNIMSANHAPNTCSPEILQNIGCIEVIVLRCAGPRSAKYGSTREKDDDKGKYKGVNLDGTNDLPYFSFGLDGQPPDYSISGHYNSPRYDDREWHQRHGSTTQPAISHYGPPPPLPSRSYSRRRTRSPTSIARTTLPPGSYQYGHGPIQHLSSVRQGIVPAPSMVGSNAQQFNPQIIDQVLMQAVKKGAAETQHSIAPVTEPINQPPGAWPPSPFTHSAPELAINNPNILGHHRGTTLVPQITAWGQRSAPTRAENKVSWDQPAPFTAPSILSSTNGWSSSETDNSSSLDSGNGWNTQSPHRGRSKTSITWSHSSLRGSSPSIRSTRTRWNRSFDSRTVRSRLQEPAWESKVDNDGWTHVDIESGSESTWSDLTVKPSSSVSALAAPSETSAPTIHSQHASVIHEPTVPPLPIPIRRGGNSPQARRYSDTIVPVVPPPFSITFEDFMKIASAKDEDAISKNHASRGRASCHKENRSTWEVYEDKQNRASKTIVTNNEEWGDAKQNTAPDNLWNSRNIKAQPDGWITTNDMVNKEGDDWGKKDNSKVHTAQENGAKVEDDSWDAFKALKGIANLWTTTNAGKDNEWWTENENWKSQSKHRDNINDWDVFPVSAKSKPNPWDAPSKSKPHKSRLSKYRQLRNPTSDTAPKPYWQFPPPLPDKKTYLTPNDMYGTVPAEPRYKISKEMAEEKGLEHQVRAGKGTKYAHHIGRPEYLDSLDKPYAVFRFKYRSYSFLKHLFGSQIPDPADLTIPLTSSVPSNPTKRELKKLLHDELVDSLLKLQTKLSEKEREIDESKAPATEVVGRNRTKDWVKQHSRETSEIGKGKWDGERKEKVKDKRKRKGGMKGEGGGWGGWGGNGGDHEGGGGAGGAGGVKWS